MLNHHTTDSFHIRATVLPEGRERDLFVHQGKLTFDQTEDAPTILNAGYLLPGLVDAHSHLAFHSPAPPGTDWDEASIASAKVELEAGVLAVRDPGGPAPVGLGPSMGLPRIITAGRFLAAPNHMFPEHGQIEVSDEELPDAAAEQLRASGEWVKVIGDFPIPGKGFEPAFRTETLEITARTVHGLGGRLAVHAIMTETIQAAVDAGADSIEHGLMISPDQAAELASRGGMLTPTMISTPGWLPGVPRQMGIPSNEIERLAEAVDNHPATIRAAWEAGANILAGTDAAIVAHGLVRDEIRLLAEAGLPIEDALGAGSWKARSFLGLPGIEEGARADLVAFVGNPLEDPGVLTKPILIVLDGRVVRAPDMETTG
ncbi:MAG TPA: amidohydrolase family protein [Acidimicrobiia bacterium]|nr:amidohydrolase family protein [Acidimicrobiia bacterium]